MFYLLLPRENADQIREYAKANEHSFISSWDIRKTLQDLAYGEVLENPDIGYSVLSQKVPAGTGCDDVPIQKPWDCYCVSW